LKKVGVRELKAHGSQILRAVREEHQSFEVTYHGAVVARLVPASSLAQASEIEAWIAEGDKLAEQIGQGWPAGRSAVEAVNESRDRLEYPEQ
jgi:prevent-host-death family protein